MYRGAVPKTQVALGAAPNTQDVPGAAPKALVAPGAAPNSEHVLSIVQHNCLRSWDVFLSLFNSFALAKHPPLIVCLQDPLVWRN